MTMTAPDPTRFDEPCICGGGGTVFVDDDYVARQAARADKLQGGALSPGLLEALRYSVFPCYECRPDQYQLWADGHFRPGHTCSTCRPRRKATGGGRRG
jgi:hypothetical protein